MMMPIMYDTYELRDGTISYIWRSLGVNVIFVLAYLNKVLTCWFLYFTKTAVKKYNIFLLDPSIFWQQMGLFSLVHLFICCILLRLTIWKIFNQSQQTLLSRRAALPFSLKNEMAFSILGMEEREILKSIVKQLCFFYCADRKSIFTSFKGGEFSSWCVLGLELRHSLDSHYGVMNKFEDSSPNTMRWKLSTMEVSCQVSCIHDNQTLT